MSERTTNARNMALISLSASEVRELIAGRAYELYNHRGAEFGNELSDWLEAEAEVITTLLAEPQETDETEKRIGQLPARTKKPTSVRKAANGARPRVSRLSKRKDAIKGNPA